MPYAITELAIGDTDGVNTIFETHRDYKTGSIVAYRNGLANVEATEHGGRTFAIPKAPLAGDVITVYYRPI